MSMDAAFATLGIAAGAQPIEITRAFRLRSREWHPDTGGDPRVFTEIVAAYRTLQRAGLADGRRTSDAERFYRRFLDGLDRVASIPSAAVAVPRQRPRDPGANVSFAEILDRELRRAG